MRFHSLLNINDTFLYTLSLEHLPELVQSPWRWRQCYSKMYGQTKQSARCKHPKYNDHLDNHHENLKNYLLYRNELGFSGRWLGLLARVPGMLLTSQLGRLCHHCSSWSSLWKIMRSLYLRWVDQDSTIGIVTCYGLHGLEIESCWGWDFTHQSLGPTQPPIQCILGLSQE
jgi:hypothetical protein